MHGVIGLTTFRSKRRIKHLFWRPLLQKETAIESEYKKTGAFLTDFKKHEVANRSNRYI
jgi:hypothetical protein